MRSPRQPPQAPDAAHWLDQTGIQYTAAPDGHLVVRAGDEEIDYWPDKQTWAPRTGLLTHERQGLHDLILYCRRPKRTTSTRRRGGSYPART